MLRRMLIGAAAGAAATVPQSAVVWGLKYAGVYRRKAPPEKIAEELSEPVIKVRELDEPLQTAVKLAEHFGFGAATGALFGLASGVLRPTVVAGVLAGLAVWKASYDGWIPAMKILPPPEEDEEGRQLAMLLAHIAYGLALGILVDRWTAKE